MNALHLVLPWVIDDPARPSGGNIYDARIRDGLRAAGWQCDEHVVAADWPQPGDAGQFRRALAELPDDALVLIDGVMAPAGADAIAGAARRLRIVVLLHMPFGDAYPALADAEHRALAACAAVLTTSAWTRGWVCDHYGLSPGRVRVATPGVAAAPRVAGSASGGHLLCVANVSRLKGHDVLVAALALLRDRDWTCTCAGALPDSGDFLGELRARADSAGIAARIRWAGPLAGAALAAAWAGADLLVAASRRESYGMAISEALAHGLPVIAPRVAGVPKALGEAPDAALPGALVEPESPRALAAALRAWLEDPELRARWRAAAARRRERLRGWPATVADVAALLREVARGADRVA